MMENCMLCGKYSRLSSWYCTACRTAAYRAIKSGLNPKLAASKHIRAELIEFVDFLPGMRGWTSIPTLDRSEVRQVQWLKSTFNRLAKSLGGQSEAKALIENYYELYAPYFDAGARPDAAAS